jgi:ABC-2 type transport system permease protein
VMAGEQARLTAYVWGESTLKNRAVASAAVATLVRDLTGQETPVEIVTSIVGAGTSLPWEDRLLPIIVMMALLMGGSVVPAALLVDEKQKRTMRALTTTSASLGEVFAAKGALGWILSILMAIITLLLNRAWGPQPALLLVSLALGALLAACIGVLGGAFIRDTNMLMTVVKGAGILLYAPALIYMFPEIPQWIARIFPTYYLIQPVIEITQQGGTLASVAPELAVLIVLTVILLAIIGVVVRRAPETEGTLNPV